MKIKLGMIFGLIAFNSLQSHILALERHGMSIDDYYNPYTLQGWELTDIHAVRDADRKVTMTAVDLANAEIFYKEALANFEDIKQNFDVVGNERAAILEERFKSIADGKLRVKYQNLYGILDRTVMALEKV